MAVRAAVVLVAVEGASEARAMVAVKEIHYDRISESNCADNGRLR